MAIIELTSVMAQRFHSKYTYMENGDPPEDNTVIKSVKNNLTGYLCEFHSIQVVLAVSDARWI